MVLLAYQSTGSEERDLEEIEARLFANKKVIVKMAGCEEAVRQQLKILFGEKSIGTLKRISQNSVTFAEEWQCEVHRDLTKVGNSTREHEREARRTYIMKTERNAPLTAEGFSEKLKTAAAPLVLDTFDPSSIPEIMVNEWRHKAALIQSREQRFKHVRGIAAEKIVPIFLRNRLENLLNTVETVYSSDVICDLQDDNTHVASGMDPDQIVFFRKDQDGHFQPYMEFDALFRTATLQEYIAFDVTTDEHKKTSIRSKK